MNTDGLAVKDNLTALTYAELDRKSDQVAYWLAKQGFHAETLIAVLAPRSCEAIVTFLGILKANLAYLPLDVNIPIGRLQSILSEVKGHTLVLMGAGLAIPDKGPADAEFLYISAIEEQQAAAVPQAAAVLPTPSATSLAYVMFTSGSTGRPKGVMIEHRGIVRLVKNSNVASQSQVAVPIAHIANLAFDAATWEIYAALLNGGSLICIDHMTVLDIPSLCQLFKREEIRAAMFTPAFLKQCLATAPEIVANLDILFASGDRLDPGDALAAQKLVKGDLINVCGHTENSVYSTIYHVKPGEPGVNGVPIGRAISNSGALVLDPQQQVLPLAAMGELVLTGDGLARGYMDPSMDHNRFIQVSINGNMLKAYRTGDRVRYRPGDGLLEFFGRMDLQVKIRGHRIELAEIETSLLRIGSVDDAAVIVRQLGNTEAELVSFVTLKNSEHRLLTESEKQNAEIGQIEEWASLFDCNTYSSIDAIDTADIGRDFLGWTSMYDGLDIDRAEMNEWLDDTITAIYSGGQPKNVFEIGSGTGMILFSLINGLESYVGVDPSAIVGT
ncbi:Nonribosomal peptide synthetase dtxS1 [Beauveria bassiana]|uniref:Nonribosomal peptide synthetase dtxS1 n=1 Tax=Beauveria bassiana TaxID=176275 RepID=A0A2N6NE81_BEABA|nr:Nonribosomal peptide synthetase dtxS1 [Beauveria bassiana]